MKNVYREVKEVGLGRKWSRCSHNKEFWVWVAPQDCPTLRQGGQASHFHPVSNIKLLSVWAARENMVPFESKSQTAITHSPSTCCGGNECLQPREDLACSLQHCSLPWYILPSISAHRNLSFSGGSTQNATTSLKFLYPDPGSGKIPHVAEQLSPYVSVCSVMSNSVQPHGLQPTSLLCPWDFSGKNTRVGFHFLLQGIFLTQGSNLCLLCLPLGRFFTC